MSPGVKSREYDNSRREAAALQTRRAVIDAAHRLFLEKGYGGTALTEVAAEAGVSVQTVYGQLGSKRNLLKEVIDVAVAGDHEPIAMRDRAEAAAVLAEPDPETKLRMLAATFTEGGVRIAPIDRVMRSAAAVDPEVAEQARQEDQSRLFGMTEIAQHLLAAGALRDGVTVEAAAQVLWWLNGPATFRPLVVEQGWSLEAYEVLLGDLLVAALAPRKPVRARR
jgi:AcrR family transcriptional regulator